MRRHYTDEQTAPRYERGCDFGKEGRVLARCGDAKLVWRPGFTARSPVEGAHQARHRGDPRGPRLPGTEARRYQDRPDRGGDALTGHSPQVRWSTQTGPLRTAAGTYRGRLRGEPIEVSITSGRSPCGQQQWEARVAYDSRLTVRHGLGAGIATAARHARKLLRELRGPITHPAELVFVESDEGNRWDGHLLGGGEVIDVKKGDTISASKPWARVEETDDGVRLTIEGRHPSARRYSRHDTVSDAQRHARRWAGRRFRRTS